MNLALSDQLTASGEQQNGESEGVITRFMLLLGNLITPLT
jgi:hypothetical protein